MNSPSRLNERASSRRSEKTHSHRDGYRAPRYSSRDRNGDYRRKREEASRDYTDRDRERERERDRGRYDRRDREYDTSHRFRRSASPGTREANSHLSRRSGSIERSPPNHAKPDFKPSGLLAAETNTVKAVDGTHKLLKYNEPPEARKPILGWRIYVFKDSEQLDLLHIHRQSAYLVGRDPLVADITVDHPSCSKQHAAIQYRYVQEKNEYGSSKGVVKPFLIDLESTNGTLVNDDLIPAARYFELKTGDVIKFGLSTREYVLLHDGAS